MILETAEQSERQTLQYALSKNWLSYSKSMDSALTCLLFGGPSADSGWTLHGFTGSLEFMPPDALILAQNAPKMLLAAGLRPDPLGELTPLPQIP